MWRRSWPISIWTYRDLVRQLLKRHRLHVPECTVAMLTNAVTSCRRGRRAPFTIAETRKRFGIALEEATVLSEYTRKPPSRRETFTNRVEKLRNELSSLEAIVWLETPMPRVRSVIHNLRAGRVLNANELATLIESLTAALSSGGGRTGRPRAATTFVVRAGCIAWFRAGRRETYNTWRSEGSGKDFANQPLGRFLRDLLNMCWLYLSDAALYSATTEARRSIRAHHPHIASGHPQSPPTFRLWTI